MGLLGSAGSSTQNQNNRQDVDSASDDVDACVPDEKDSHEESQLITDLATGQQVSGDEEPIRILTKEETTTQQNGSHEGAVEQHRVNDSDNLLTQSISLSSVVGNPIPLTRLGNIPTSTTHGACVEREEMRTRRHRTDSNSSTLSQTTRANAVLDSISAFKR